MESKLLPCKCGKAAKVRYKIPYTWVECKRKCGMHTGVYCDGYEQCDPESRKQAIADWNKLIREQLQTH